MPSSTYPVYISSPSTSYRNPCQGHGYLAVALIENITYLICDPNASAPGLSDEDKLALGLGLGLGLVALAFLVCWCRAEFGYCVNRRHPITQMITAEPLPGWNPEYQQMLTSVSYQNLIHNRLRDSLKAELYSIKLRADDRRILTAFQEHACDHGAHDVVRYIQTLIQPSSEV